MLELPSPVAWVIENLPEVIRESAPLLMSTAMGYECWMITGAKDAFPAVLR